MSEDGNFYNTPKDVSNMPVVQSNINTSVANYHPCQYTSLDYIYEKDGKNETVNLYTEKQGVEEKANLEIGIIVGKDPKKFAFRVDEKSNTIECRFHNEANDHSKNIFTYDKRICPKDITVTSHLLKSIEGTVKFDYDKHNIFNYIWPTKSVTGSFSLIKINAATCRTLSLSHEINLKIFPDVRWELAFLFALKNSLAYTYDKGKNQDKSADDKKAKGALIYAEAHKKAYNSGIDNRKLREGKNLDSEFFLSLKAKYNKVENSVPLRYANEDETGEKWAKKISDFLDIIMKLKNLAQEVKDLAGGAARDPNTTLGSIVNDKPFSFEILTPKIGAVIQWQAEEVNNNNIKNAIANTGTIKFVADPLIGAEFTINMLAAASKMHPIVFTIKKGLDIALNALGGYMKLDAILYGELKITIESLKINSLEGVTITEKPPKIDGKMGVKIVFQLHVEGKVEMLGLLPEIDFKADAKFEADAFFGGTALINADKEGVYADITGMFSGLLLTMKIDIKIGQYYKKIKIEQEPIFPSNVIPLGKLYLVN